MKNDFEVCGDITKIFMDRKDGSRVAALIDTEDLHKVSSSRYSWCVTEDVITKAFYVRIYTPKGRNVKTSLHRLVMDAPIGLVVDHINHDTLDNRKSNLRVVTSDQNNQNRKGASKSGSTGVLNVHWDKNKKKYQVRVMVNKKKHFFGLYDTVDQAAKVAKEARKELGLLDKQRRKA